MSNGFYFFLGCLAGLLIAALWRYVNRNTRRVNKWSWMARKRWYDWYKDEFHAMPEIPDFKPRRKAPKKNNKIGS